MNRTIEVIVSPRGDISVEAVGFQGADCEAATRFIEEALGKQTDRTRKPEYHQPRRVQRKQRLGS